MNNLEKAMKNLRESKKIESDKLAKLVEKKNLNEDIEDVYKKLNPENDPDKKDQIDLAMKSLNLNPDQYLELMKERGKLTEDIVETTTRQDLIAIQEKGSGLYDYVANNYYKMTPGELKELALNAIYVADADAEIIQEYLDRNED